MQAFILKEKKEMFKFYFIHSFTLLMFTSFVRFGNEIDFLYVHIHTHKYFSFYMFTSTAILQQ